jgi:hypothetical protein
MLQQRKLKLTRRGAISALVALLIVVLLGVTAFAIDGGMVQDNKRRLQATADAAALAAASKIFQNFRNVSISTPDPSGQALDAARAVAKDNGFEHNGGTVKVLVNIPPATGPFAGKLGYAEVCVEYKQPRYFSSVWGSEPILISSRAVAIGRWVGSKQGIIVLDLTAAHALDINGTGLVTVTGGASVIVNSNDPVAAARDTGGGTVYASEFYVVGGVSGNFNGTIVHGPPVPDPLAYLPEPPQPPDGVMITENLTMGNKRYTFSPGRFTGVPSFNQGDEVVFKQASAGIYYLENTGFSSQGANISMDPTTSGGMMIYNKVTGNANNMGINITGNASGSVAMSALTSGPYAGILFFQSRNAPQTMSVAGNGSFNLSGTFYCANALLNVAGGGTATIGSQYISRYLNITGGGNISIDYNDNGTAKLREIRLVE